MGHSYKGGSVPFKGGGPDTSFLAPTLNATNRGTFNADLQPNSFSVDEPYSDNWTIYLSTYPVSVGQDLNGFFQPGTIPSDAEATEAAFPYQGQSGYFYATYNSGGEESPPSAIVTVGPLATVKQASGTTLQVDDSTPGVVSYYWERWTEATGGVNTLLQNTASKTLDVTDGDGFWYTCQGLSSDGYPVLACANFFYYAG